MGKQISGAMPAGLGFNNAQIIYNLISRHVQTSRIWLKLVSNCARTGTQGLINPKKSCRTNGCVSNVAHCPVWESRGPEGIRKFRILRGALKIVSMLWIYHLIHGIKIFCFKHFLIYCLPIMSIHSEGWRQENQIVARRRNSFEYKLWLNLKNDILMSNFQLFFLKNIK